MSARDSSDPAGPGSRGAGGLGNGGVGGGFGGGANGGMGAGAGRNGGYDNRTGLGTGATMYGNTAFGRPGGMATGYATRDMASLARAGMGPMAGSYGNFRDLNGQQMFAGSPVQGQSFTAMGAGQALSQAQRAQAAWQAAQQPPQRPHVGGLLDDEKVLSIEDLPPEMPPAAPAVNPILSMPNYMPAFMNPILGPNFMNTYPRGSTFTQNNLGNPYDQYQPAPKGAPGKGDYQGQQPAVAGGKADYQGSNFNGYKGYY